MSDLVIREEAIEKLIARLLDSRTKATTLAVEATEQAIEAKNALDKASAIITESPTSVKEVDPDDEWGDLDMEDPTITKLKADVARLAQKAEQLNKEAEKAIRAHEEGPTGDEINHEVSLLKGKLNQIGNIAREQAIKAKKKAEKDKLEAQRVARQEEEARQIAEEEARKKAYYDSLSEADRIKYDETREKAALEEKHRKFIAEHMAKNGWDDERRGTDSKGRPCVSGEERILKDLAQAAWVKKLEQERRDASRAQVISRPISTFQRENCKFPTCFKPGCNFLHTLTQCASARRERCVYYENCGNKRCTDLHTYKFIESSEP